MKKQRFEINPSTKEIRGTFVISKNPLFSFFLLYLIYLNHTVGNSNSKLGLHTNMLGKKQKILDTNIFLCPKGSIYNC